MLTFLTTQVFTATIQPHGVPHITASELAGPTETLRDFACFQADKGVMECAMSDDGVDTGLTSPPYSGKGRLVHMGPFLEHEVEMIAAYRDAQCLSSAVRGGNVAKMTLLLVMLAL
jgi:hypothetical protein